MNYVSHLFISHRKILFILLVAGILIVSISLWHAPSSHAAGTTYYVATNGSDSSPGTESAPFKTIQKAADVVNPGDTILVNDGVYTGGSNQVVNATRGGTTGNPITFKSINKYGAKLSGQNNTTSIGWYVAVDYLIVQDFEFYGFSSAAVDIFNANDQLIGNHIHDIGRFCSDSAFGFVGIYLSRAMALTIERNVIHDVGRYEPGENGCNLTQSYYQNNDHGLYIDSSSNITARITFSIPTIEVGLFRCILIQCRTSIF
jgi:Protein of unknown function (DUF1565)